MTPPTPETPDADRMIAEMITAEAYAAELYPDRHTIERWRMGMQALRARLAEAEKDDVEELKRLLGMAQANPDLVDADQWNEEVDAALAALAPKEKPCPT